MTVDCMEKNSSGSVISDTNENAHSAHKNSPTQDHAQEQQSQDVEIQFLKEMLTYKNLSTMGTEMVIQTMATQGASMANAYITSQAQLLSAKIDRDSQTIQTSMQSFQKKAQNDQQAKLKNMISAFSQAQKMYKIKPLKPMLYQILNSIICTKI